MPTTMQEEGHLYKAEQPTYHKGEEGKGASIAGKVTAKGGTPFKFADKYAATLKKTWNHALNAKSKFR